KRYVSPPRLAAGDGPIGAMRHWARQFYPPDDREHIPAPASLTARPDRETPDGTPLHR
ncbi:(2Fe-2S)-binding protein, partial [Kitasatospora sp. NPDC001539]